LENSPSGSSYDNCEACHAEQSALLFSDYTARKDGGTIVVNGPPCFTCAKLIANSGLTELIYLPDPSYADWPRVEAFLKQVLFDVIPVGRGDL
jgi:deoxycytidylate deaminase